MDTILGSPVNKNQDGLCDCLKRMGILTLTSCNFSISTLIMKPKNDNLYDLMQLSKLCVELDVLVTRRSPYW